MSVPVFWEHFWPDPVNLPHHSRRCHQLGKTAIVHISDLNTSVIGFAHIGMHSRFHIRDLLLAHNYW